MSLSKKQRQAIWDKSEGHCWYCGCELPEKGWHADHFHPIIRKVKSVPGDHPRTYKLVSTNEAFRPEHDTLENRVPSCAPCNLFKGTFSVEGFRRELEAQVERARRSSVNFRMAERFGQLRVFENPVVFWFENNHHG